MGDFFQGFGAGFLALATTTVAAQVLHAAYQRRRQLAEVQRQHALQRAEAAVPPREWPPAEPLDPLGLTTVPAGAWGTDGTYWTADDILRNEG